MSKNLTQRRTLYTKTIGEQCAYNQYSHDEFFSIDELLEDANKHYEQKCKDNEKLWSMLSRCEIHISASIDATFKEDNPQELLTEFWGQLRDFLQVREFKQ